jgi:hypothetical protein
MMAGTAALTPAAPKKTPKYRIEGFGWNPSIGRPIAAIKQFTTIILARVW